MMITLAMKFSLLLIVTIIVLSIPSECAIDLSDISSEGADVLVGVDFNQQASLLSHRIEGLLNHGRSDEALTVINELSKEYSSLSTIQIHLARAHVQRKNYALAETILLNVITINSSEDDESRLQAHLTLGRLYLQLKRWNDAQKCLEYVLTLDESNVTALMSMSKVWLNRDSDVRKAKMFIELAYNISPNDEKVLFEYGMMLLQTNDHIKAKQALDRAEAINPNIDHKMLGNIYLYYQHIDWATPHFEQAFISMQANYNSSSDSLTGASRMSVDTELVTLLADCKDYMGDYSMAIDLYNLALQVEPMNALANGGLGLLLLGTGTRNYASINACGLNQEEAITHLRMALSVRPDLEMVQRALDFCKLEFTEANQWSKVVATDSTTTVTTASSSDNERRKNVLTRVLGNMLSPHHILISPMQALCRWLKRRSYHGVFAVLCNGSTILNSSSSTGRGSKGANFAAIDAMKKNWRRREQSIQSSLPHVSLLSSTQDGRAAVNSSSELSAEQFIRDYMLTNQPAVLLNMQESWDVMMTGNSVNRRRRSSLSLDALLDKFGEDLVRVSVSEHGRFDGPEAGDRWGLSSDIDVLVRPPATTMRFRDFLYLVKSSATRETFYLEYLALNQYLGKHFLDLIPFPESLLSYIGGISRNSSSDGRRGAGMLEHLVTNLWIGSKPTTSPLHYDDYENFLCQISGYKELILYPPSDLEYLYYIGRPKGILKYSYPGVFTRDPSSVDKNHFVFGSSVNIDRPDLQRFPRFTNAKPIRVLLKPGQVLYLPSFWHHEVQSIPSDDDDDGLNIAVNFWFKNITFPVDDMKILGMK